MNDFAAIFNADIDSGNNRIGQIQIANLPAFAAEADKFEHEFKNGGLLAGFFRKDDARLPEPVFQRYREPMVTMLALCVRGGLNDDDWRFASELMLRINKDYFLRERGNGSRNWFDAVQLLVANGHQLNAIGSYTYSAFIGFSKAAAQLEINRQKRQALAVRYGYGADHKTFKQWIEG